MESWKIFEKSKEFHSQKEVKKVKLNFEKIDRVRNCLKKNFGKSESLVKILGRVSEYNYKK